MHTNHIDKKLIQHIQTSVKEGCVNVRQVQRSCEQFTKDRFPEHNINKEDTRFYPTRKDVYNHIYHSLSDSR